MPWHFRKYGSISDPVHKSHLNDITGEYGCPRRFRYQRDADADPAPREPSALMPRVSGSLAVGSAVHETIARALNNPDVIGRLMRDGEVPTRERIGITFEAELALAADGRVIDWGKESSDVMMTSGVSMVEGLLRDLPRYVRRVIAVEPGFIVQLEGVWYSGHVDLIFEPRDVPGAIAIADWKTAKSKPDSIELAHGWEGGIYSLACERGDFLAREAVMLRDCNSDGEHGWVGTVEFDGDIPQRANAVRDSRWQCERDTLELALQTYAHRPNELTHPLLQRFSRYPSRVYHVHLRDYVPYLKAGSKVAKRPEDLAHYGLASEATIKYAAGDLRGPAWLPVELHPNDVARLAYRARQVIGTCRMGRFVDLVREHCRRCAFSRDCLTGGYAARGDDLTELEQTLKKAGL